VEKAHQTIFVLVPPQAPGSGAEFGLRWPQQVIRPRAVLDPGCGGAPVRAGRRPARGRSGFGPERQERCLINHLTKRMGRVISRFNLAEEWVRSPLFALGDPLDRADLNHSGSPQCLFLMPLIGVNLLREGLELAGGFSGAIPRCVNKGRIPAGRALLDSDDRPAAPMVRQAPALTPTTHRTSMANSHLRRRNGAGLQQNI